MYKNYVRLLKFVFVTRFIYFFLSVFSNALIPDHVPDAFKSAGTIYQVFDNERGVFWKLFSGFQNWDVQHYVHIAQFGYTYENNLAFFPLYPYLLRFFSTYFKIFLPVLNPLLLFTVVGVILNVFFFTSASLALYELTLIVFKNEEFAYRTAILFCFSPASIFFLAPYTESLFSFLVFRGLIGYAKHDFKKAAFWFCVATGARSNGMTYLIFFAHAYTYYFQELFDKRCVFSILNFELGLNFIKSITKVFFIICSPYLLFQGYGYYLFCFKRNGRINSLLLTHAELYNLTVPTGHTDWCDQAIPFNYFFIQKKYWNVGFFRYFSFKQIPNFLLALPMTFIILKAGYRYLKKNYRYTFTLKPVYDCVPDVGSPELPPLILPYVLHAVFLTIWAFFSINVQVLTRLLASSSPLLYWIVAHHCFQLKPRVVTNRVHKRTKKSFCRDLLDSIPFEGNKCPTITTILYKLYFLSYTFVGIVLFNNAYPWT